MTKGSVNSIETFGLVDGPGIRNVIFLNGCKLRCKYCHNPEMWKLGEYNYEPIEIVNKVKRFKPYFGSDGGVTFSGGEPLLQKDFLIETMKILKEENINIAIDTSGVGIGNYEEILKYTDIVLLDIKHVDLDKYQYITGLPDQSEFDKFVEALNKSNAKVWIRQVIVPGIMDNITYLIKLKKYLKNIKNIERIDFLPYHKLGREKYISLGLDYPLENVNEMDIDKNNELYEIFKKLEV